MRLSQSGKTANGVSMGSLSKILIVDDMPANVKLLEAILDKPEYEIIEAFSGEDAVDIAREEHPTLILLDIMMPGMDGFEVCKVLSEDPATSDIGIICISARNSIEDKVKGLELGAVDFITKPFHKSEVIARVETHIDLQKTTNLLKESEKKYAALVENVHDGIVLWTPEKGISFCNKAFSKIIGADRESIIGKQLADIFTVKDEIRASSLLNKIIEEKLQSETPELNLQMKTNSEEEEVHTSCICSYIDFMETPAVLITVRDITDKINLERQLNQAQKMEAIGALTSGIAHDFNNILALINGYTELTLFELEADSPIREKLEIIHEAGKSAVSLTKGLLSFGRKKSLNFEHVNLVEVVAKIQGFMTRGLPKNVKLNLSLPENEVQAYADAGMIQQVMVNLCLNARDAMPKGGDINITMTNTSFDKLPPHAPEKATPGDYILITIADTGSGIPDEIIDKIFDPFFTTKQVGKGSGMGLAMVVRIIRNHQGWIEVDSKPENGATFKIFLPKSKDPAQAEQKSQYQHQFHESLNPLLIVEDDEVQSAMLIDTLGKYGYECDANNNGISSLAAVENSPEKYKFLIIDHVMPDMTGADCCRKIRKMFPHIKILLISGAGNVPLAGDAFLRKPFTSLDLFETMDRLS